MQRKEQEIFLIIKTYVQDKKNINITLDTCLYSEGILDSLDMFGLVMQLEKYGFILNYPQKDIQNRIYEIDKPSQIIELVK